MSATIDNFSSPYVVEAAPRTASSSDGIEIEFIGPGGEVLKTVSGPEGELSLAPAYRYVRAKVTWKQTLDSRVDDSQARREFFAWTQPVFLDAALPAHGELLTESR
jgi:hypothetical protein